MSQGNVHSALVVPQARSRGEDFDMTSLFAPEVLGRIFLYLVDIYPMELASTNGRKSLGWICVTHVGRRWRHIAINYPSLWTRLSLTQDRPWNTFLERAKKAPLIITMDIMAPFVGRPSFVMPIERMHSVHQHRDHIQKLCLTSLASNSAQELVSGLSGPLPGLHQLTLEIANDWGMAPSLTPQFLTATAPNLRQLRLTGVTFPWGYSSLNITEFHYEHIEYHRPNTPATFPKTHIFSQVVATLRGMPSLKDLKLVHALPRPKASDSSLPEIHLQSLERLHISSHNDAPWLLWSLLKHPSRTSIHIHDTHTAKGIGSRIAAKLRAHCHTSLSTHFQMLAVDVQNQGGKKRRLILQLSEADELEDVAGDETEAAVIEFPAYLKLDICCNYTELHASELIAAVALEHVRTVSITGDIGSSQSVYDSFASARAVTVLQLHGGVRNVFPALIPTVAGDIERTIALHAQSSIHHLSPDSMLFPSLDEITCTAVDFTDVHVNMRYGAAMTRLHSVLRRVLRDRSEVLGMALRMLRIGVACNVQRPWVDGWSQHVDELVEYNEETEM